MSDRSLILQFKNQLSREISLRVRDYKYIFNAVLFFLMIVIFFPLTIPINSPGLNLLIPGMIWIGLIFSIFLSSENLFAQDYADGIIEQWLVSTIPITLLVFAKLIVHGLIIISSVVFLSPILAVIFNLTLYQVFILDMSVIFGAPSVISICALSEAFTVGIKQKSLIMGLVVLPLNIPILILGSAIIRAVIIHEPVSGMLAILLAISCLSGFLLPFAIAGVVRVCLL
jgi:heme exporter protein B